MKEIILLGIIFIMPALFIIIRNFLWDLSFWQKKNYSLERFSLNILWDLDKDIFSHNLIIIKFIAFAFLALGFQYSVSGAIGIAAVFLIWAFEAFKRLQDIFLTREPRIDLSKPRNLISTLSMLATILFIFLLITLPFVYSISSNKLPLVPIPDLQVTELYVYLLILSSLFILIDLSTSLLTLIQQLLINLIVGLRRKFKLYAYFNRILFLQSRNRIILVLSDNFHEMSNLLLSGVENLISIDNEDLDFVKEYILDNKVEGKILIINASHSTIQYEINNLKPECVIINSEEANIESLINKIPLQTKIIVNSDLFDSKFVTEKFKGQTAFFGENPIDIPNNSNFVWKLRTKISEAKIATNFISNFKDIKAEIHTFNNQYPAALAVALTLVKELGFDEDIFIQKVQATFVDSKSNLFINGDNDTRILSFLNKELTHVELRNNLLSASKYKEGNKIILLTNGLGRKVIPERFYSDISKIVDIVISNDNKLVQGLKNHSVKSFYADSFKNFTYLARRFSEKGDLIIVEGHFKEPLIRLLRKN